MSYYLFTLKDMLKTDDNPDGCYRESEIKAILSDFSCPFNADIQSFIRQKALEFSKQSIAETFLVYTEYRNELVLAGYFTLANKGFSVSTKPKQLSSRLKKRLSKFSMNALNERVIRADHMFIPALLIAQLSKNFANGYNELISGDELLNLALDQVKRAQGIIGGKVCYIECEDKERIINFYLENGFVNFGKRRLEREEKTQYEGEYLIQMLKYI